MKRAPAVVPAVAFVLASGCAGGPPSGPASSASSPAPVGSPPWKGRVLVHPDPEESIELVGDDGQRGFVADPYSLPLWRYFHDSRIELWSTACPPSIPATRSGVPHVCVVHWRHEGKGGDHVEVGPEQTLRGRFVDATGPKGSKRESEREVRFKWADSELLVENAPANAPRDREVTIRARVVDVQSMQTYAMVMGPRLWILEVK